MPTKTILITGCSTGIGRDLARRLAQANYTVIATARRPETLADLPVALRLPLDVTDEASIASAVEEVIRRFGRVDVLVNNAGIAYFAAVEELPEHDARQMFDVNVYGMIHMIRAVVPQMRRQGGGRIINMSSIAGRRSTPVNGVYSATKFAVEALSDALRIELAPFGIQVALIEPGSIDTPFSPKAQTHTQAILSNPASPYQAFYQRYTAMGASAGGQDPEPEVVTRAVRRAIEATRPRTRYLVAVPWRVRLTLPLGHAVWNLMLKRMFRVPPVPPAATHPATHPAPTAGVAPSPLAGTS
jgi:NAD(P)-dependent dehydrogenase (short-subunit alcohol dehydrogenase family)